MNWYMNVFSKWSDFNTRSRRKEYWMFGIFHYSISFILLLLDRINKTEELLCSIYTLIIFVPLTAITIRRLNDLSISNSWKYLLVIFFIFCPGGGLFHICFMAHEGTTGPNQYGPDPKA